MARTRKTTSASGKGRKRKAGGDHDPSPVPAANAGAAGSPNEVPEGATRRAFDREENGGRTPGSPMGDRHMEGTPAGGTETGGLAGSNVGTGEPLEEGERPDDSEEEMAYGGPSGGAVGGTPAEGRSSGGVIHRGLAPGGGHRGDSTIGSTDAAGG